MRTAWPHPQGLADAEPGDVLVVDAQGSDRAVRARCVRQHQLLLRSIGLPLP